jgi:uncharacterized membrane protein YbhN (UPF0104 family)
VGGTAWGRIRLVGGGAILAVLVWRLGAGPFVHGVLALRPTTVLAAAAITAGTTLAAAWRWRVVARGLGVDLPLGPAVAAYYRSQFLNSALPGGVLGDVHRGVRHGRDSGDVGRGLRAVGWERVAGQVLQAALTVPVLVALDSPVRAAMPAVLMATGAGAVGVALVLRARSRRATSRLARAVRTAGSDLRAGLLNRRAWPRITGASLICVAGHATIFGIAAETTGTAASPARLLPLALLLLSAMAIPLTVGGWGPREGVAAWAFGAAGLGAAQGVAAATAYGVMALAATLPGALVLAAEWLPRRSALRAPLVPTPDPEAAHG